jgi:hypothetical protein
MFTIGTMGPTNMLVLNYPRGAHIRIGELHQQVQADLCLQALYWYPPRLGFLPALSLRCLGCRLWRSHQDRSSMSGHA